MLKRIISGGQTGVDIASLRAAKAVGLETGGFIPLGFRTEAGNKPEYGAEYGLVETKSRAYPERTKLNVEASDMTLLIGTDLDSPGSRVTKLACNIARKLRADLQWPVSGHMPCTPVEEQLVQAIIDSGCSTLNVAGNRDPGLEAVVEEYLTTYIFAEVLRRQSAPTPPPAQEGE